MKKVSRRELLAGVAAGGALVGASRPANAFFEQEAPVKFRSLHDGTGGAAAAHKKLIAEVERVLGDKYSEAEKQQVTAALTCPICGRPLIGPS